MWMFDWIRVSSPAVSMPSMCCSDGRTVVDSDLALSSDDDVDEDKSQHAAEHKVNC